MQMNETTPVLTSEEKTMAMASHLLTFLGYLIPFGNIIGPLVVFLAKKDSSPFIRHHASEALNFQISLTIYLIVSAILIFIIIGIAMIAVLFIVDLICTIIGAIRASDGEGYRYPMTIRFIS